MDQNLVKALDKAEKLVPFYSVTKIYDCGEFYYFDCIRKDNEKVNGPCINKKTLDEMSISSSDLMSYSWSNIFDAEDVRNYSKQSSL